MNKSSDKKLRYLEKEEYLEAKKREDELYKILAPWVDSRYPRQLKSDAPDGYNELLKEFREVAQNVYYTEFMDGCAY